MVCYLCTKLSVLCCILIVCGQLLNKFTVSVETCQNHRDMPLSNVLRIASLNSRGLRAAQPYLNKLAVQSDIVIISEHCLYESQMYRLNDISTDYVSYGKSSQNLNPDLVGILPGHGGVAILWRKNMSCQVRQMRNMGTDRIVVIQLFVQNGNRPIFIIGVYLPQHGCKVDNYQQHLDALENVVQQCSLTGDVIVAGDFNAHFGTEEDFSRCSGKTSYNGRKLKKMMNACSLTPVDLLRFCEGPEFSFENSRGDRSYIDHILVSNHCVNDVLSCEVTEDVLNTSDHLALVCKLNLQGYLIRENAAQVNTEYKVAWHKLSAPECEHYYTERVDQKLLSALSYLEPFGNTNSLRDCIQQGFDTFLCVLKDVCRNLPTIQYQKHLKPYWNQGLSDRAAKKRRAWQRWVAAGRPKNESDVWTAYKEAKKEFRREQRKASIEHEHKYLDKIVKAQEINQKDFWRLINSRRKPKNGRIHPIVDKYGNTVRETAQIVRVWQEYYSDLYTPVESGAFDETFRLNVERELESIDMSPSDEDSTILNAPITSEEVCQASKSLKMGKATGIDGIQSEHLKYGGPFMHLFLARLFTLMTTAEWRPPVMRKGIIIPVPKGSKDPSIPDNNRGITLRSILGKLYDKILLGRAEQWFKSERNDQQGANRPAVSSLHTALMLRETIEHNASKGKPVYTCLLDTKKAFDTVWQDGLFYKLNQHGMDKKLWRILRRVYKQFECSVSIGGNLSEWFYPKQGVHQGDVFSMELYGMFNDELLHHLKNSQNGATVGTVCCGNPTFADDIALVTQTKVALNKQLEIACKYSHKWRFDFHANKTLGLIFQKDKRPDLPIKLGENVVEITDRANHLGVPVYTSEKCENAVIDDRIRACRKCFYMLEGIGSGGRGFDPLTLSKLYQTVCLPKLLYGIEIWSVTDKSIDRLEQLQHEIGRKIQRLPPLSAHPVNYVLLGWRSIRECIAVRRLLFLVELLRLPLDLLITQLTLQILTDCRFGLLSMSPISGLYQTAKMYGLSSDINKMLDSGELPSKLGWKKKIEDVVHTVASHKWIVECNLYSSLKLMIEVVPKPHVNIWWVVCKKNPHFRRHCTVMIKLITGNHNLNSGRRQYVVKTRTCQLCGIAEETVEHFLFACQATHVYRDVMWHQVTTSMPEAMSREVTSMNFDGRSVFLLSGLRSEYVTEWNSIYLSILTFVFKLYIVASERRPGL